jgi:hypothetical protein
MNRFDAQTLAQAGSKDKTFEMIFEDAKGNRFNLSIPDHVALALIPVLDKVNTASKAVGAYAQMAQEWRTARDSDSPNVFLEIKGQAPFVFPLEGAKQLWQQVRDHCEEIEGRPKRRDS